MSRLKPGSRFSRSWRKSAHSLFQTLHGGISLCLKVTCYAKCKKSSCFLPPRYNILSSMLPKLKSPPLRTLSPMTKATIVFEAYLVSRFLKWQKMHNMRPFNGYKVATDWFFFSIRPQTGCIVGKCCRRIVAQSFIMYFSGNQHIFFKHFWLYYGKTQTCDIRS